MVAPQKHVAAGAPKCCSDGAGTCGASGGGDCGCNKVRLPPFCQVDLLSVECEVLLLRQLWSHHTNYCMLGCVLQVLVDMAAFGLVGGTGSHGERRKEVRLSPLLPG